MAAYNRNRTAANDLVLEGLVLLPSIESLWAEQGSFLGTATELLDALREAPRKQRGDQHARLAFEWPGLSSMLRRFEPHLASLGIDIRFDQTVTETPRC